MTSGSGPTGGDMESRVRALETNFEKMDGKLDKILDRLAAHDVRLASLDGKLDAIEAKFDTIEAKLDTKASAVDLARIAGRVEALPTTWQMITLVFGILGGAFLILRFGLVHAP